MRYQGKIASWKEDRGFGFIIPKGGGKQIFVHVKSFSSRQRRPVGNEMVTYELMMDAEGRGQAESVAFADEPVPSSALSIGSYGSIFMATAFLIFVAVATLAGKLPLAVLWLYLGASTVAFIAYAFDKSAARKNQWRTQESTLHLFALIGGWPGALAAQKLLRHKSKKQSFQATFWATVVINCGAFGWLFTAQGAEKLHSALGTIQRLTSQ